MSLPLVAGLALVGAAAPVANAASVTSSGNPGAVGIPKTDAWANYSTYPEVAYMPRVATRAPIAGSQRIGTVYYTYVWNSSTGWKLYDQHAVMSPWISAGQTVTFHEYDVSVAPLHWYHTQAITVWYNSAGKVAGSKVVDYSSSNDYLPLNNGAIVDDGFGGVYLSFTPVG